MLGDIMLLNICAGEWEKAKIVFQTLTDEEEDKVLGVPDVEAITAYMDACIANRDIRKSVVSYGWTRGFCVRNRSTELYLIDDGTNFVYRIV